MQEQVANLKQRVDAIRKTGKVPHWRMVYAEYLLNRAQEYLAVDREPEAKLVAAKIDRWVVQHTPKPEERSAAELHPMEFWNKDLLAGISSQIKKTGYIVQRQESGACTPKRESCAAKPTVSFLIGKSRLQYAAPALLKLSSASQKLQKQQQKRKPNRAERRRSPL